MSTKSYCNFCFYCQHINGRTIFMEPCGTSVHLLIYLEKKRKPHVQIRCNLAGQSSLLPEEYKLTTSFYITPSVVAVETLLQHLFNVLMLQNILILGVKSSLPQQTRKYQLEGSGLFLFLTINYLLVKSCSFVWIVAKFEQKKRP